MARSDFNYIPVNHTFTANSPVFETEFPVELSGGQTVVDDGYLTITVVVGPTAGAPAFMSPADWRTSSTPP